MKAKQCNATLRDLLSDMYSTVLDNKSDIDDLMKHVLRSLDFFRSCCALPEKVTAGKPAAKNLSVVFNNDDIKSSEELSKCATVSKIIQSLNDAVCDYLKRANAKNLYINCCRYLSTIKKFSKSIPYNYEKLDKLLFIMSEFISYDMTTNNAYTWAATSFLFHVLYVSVTAVLMHYHNMSVCTHITPKQDNVQSLAQLFELKRFFLDQFMVEVLPKMISFELQEAGGQITFHGTSLPETEVQPLMSLLQSYNNDSLTPESVRRFLLKHGHNLLHITAGERVDFDPKLITRVLEARPEEPKQEVKPDYKSRMPPDADYKKIILLKFFNLLEKCAQAYKEKKVPQSSMVVNVFEGTRQITIKDGQVIVKS